MEDKHILKSHNKSLLIYHIVCPAKYRRKVFTEAVEQTLRGVWWDKRKTWNLLCGNWSRWGSGTFFGSKCSNVFPKESSTNDQEHNRIRIFKHHLGVKNKLWGGKLWTSGYYVNTVGQYGNAEVIKRYVENQGKKYKQIYRDQLRLFDE